MKVTRKLWVVPIVVLFGCQMMPLNSITEEEYNQIADRFYSLQDAGISGYMCQVRSNFARVVAWPYLRQGVFSQEEFDKLDEVAFDFQVHENGYCQAPRIQELELSDPNLNVFFVNAFAQSERFLLDFCRILRLMHVKNPLDELVGDNGRLVKSSDGYNIIVEGSRRRAGYISSDLREVQSKTEAEEATVYFTPFEDKFVPQILVLKKAGQTITADLSFSPVVNHLMPDVIRVTAEIEEQGERSLTYTFNSCVPIQEI